MWPVNYHGAAHCSDGDDGDGVEGGGLDGDGGDSDVVDGGDGGDFDFIHPVVEPTQV